MVGLAAPAGDGCVAASTAPGIPATACDWRRSSEGDRGAARYLVSIKRLAPIEEMGATVSEQNQRDRWELMLDHGTTSEVPADQLNPNRGPGSTAAMVIWIGKKTQVQAQLAHAACIKEFRWWFTRCDSKVLPLVLESSLFGFEQSISLFEDDVDELCRECGTPTPAMFVLYMKALYEKMKRNNYNLAFPELISTGPEWINCGTNMLAKRLDKSTPAIVPVHISKPKEHWCLAVIVPFVDEEHVFWFDSLNTQIERSCIQKIEDAINTYSVSTSEGRKKIIWERVKCRKQAGNWESGFYVMMFMRDILMREKSLNFTKEGLESCLTCYPTEQSVVDDIYLLKWELLEQYRWHHPEYEPEAYI